jgi:hypothetical protein
MLYNAFHPSKGTRNGKGKRICVVQKEYPTAGNLGKPQRQHWDISVIKNPPECLPNISKYSYDCLKLAAVIEFGMNEGLGAFAAMM